jgi:Fe-Mn family superoxide dismutase
MFTEQKFQINNLIGISDKTMEEHLKLYSGYVKNANLIIEHGVELSKDAEKYSYELAELQRRFGFEWGGMRNHEVYFSLLEGGPNTDAPKLIKKIEEQWGSFDVFLTRMKMLAMTRGVGWAMLYYDKKTDMLVPGWVDEQHLGQLADCRIVFALDMWEHSFVADYQPSGKKQYIEDFFANVNWSVAEKYFIEASK